MSACDHKFVGSESCLKCGWVPNAAAIASRLKPMHVVPEPVTAPKPGDVVVERRHREAAMSAMGVEKPSSADYVTVFLDYGSDPSIIFPITRAVAKALATIEHNARREAFIDVAAGLDAAQSEAEMAVVEAAVERFEYHNTIAAFADWSRAEKQKVNDLDSALDGATEALLALRAAGGETDG